MEVPVFDAGNGRTLSLPVAGEHSLVTGVTGSGKSTTIRVTLAGAAYNPAVALVLLDPKRGVELAAWAPRAARIGRTPAECADVLGELVSLMEARYDYLAAEGRQLWEPGKDGPAVLAAVDELRVLFRGGSDKDASNRAEAALADLLLIGRAAGISILAGTQRPSAESLSLDLRDQFGVRVAHRLGSIESVRMVFGNDLAEQAPAHRLPEGNQHAGRAYVMLDGATVAAGWTMWLDGADVPRIAAQTADLAPALVFPDVVPSGPSRATWQAPKSAQGDRLDQALLDALDDGPSTYNDLAARVGTTADAARKRLGRLEQVGRVHHEPGSPTWALVS